MQRDKNRQTMIYPLDGLLEWMRCIKWSYWEDHL